MSIIQDCLNEYSLFIKDLKNLVNIKSVLTDEEGIRKGLSYCKNVFENSLTNYHIDYDEGHNLVAVPQNIDIEKDIIYLSAHIDTVDADAGTWQSPYSPWQVEEDEAWIVGRGVSDCKAGVSFQLWVARLLFLKKISLHNIIFTITAHEEGIGVKTAKYIAKQIGYKLPLSKKSTYWLVLENTVLLNPSKETELGLYLQERSSYLISLTGKISFLQGSLQRLVHWSPVYIEPIGRVLNKEAGNYQIAKQAGGHVCSVHRNDNQLVNVIIQATPHSMLWAGNSRAVSSIPTEIYQLNGQEELSHQLILSNRSFDTPAIIEEELINIPYTAIKPFSESVGMNMIDKINQSAILEIVTRLNKNSKDITINCTHNIGASDASIVYHHIARDKKERFYPIVIGPGTRSFKTPSFLRLTHGVHESFNKLAGEKACQTILAMMMMING
ncbi:MAG: M20/M25/M40 family metallo-hydrolase [Phycisphaerales bacterium]|nr:M20/M25/M40 family metallo-hydrolase [Phycisphaerales bacterium]